MGGNSIGYTIQSTEASTQTGYSLHLNPNGGAVSVGASGAVGALEGILKVTKTDGATHGNNVVSLFNSIASLKIEPKSATAGAYNGLVNVGDSRIIFSTDGDFLASSGGLVIGPHSPTLSGLKIMENGFVGIGITPTFAKLEVDGNVRAQGNASRSGVSGAYTGNFYNIEWTGANANLWIDTVNVGNISLTSDRRIKENIETQTTSALDMVKSLRPVSFTRKNIDGTIFKENSNTELGFIADELQMVIPSAVNGDKNALTSDGKIQPQTLNMGPIVSVLTKAIQEIDFKLSTENSTTTDVFATSSATTTVLVNGTLETGFTHFVRLSIEKLSDYMLNMTLSVKEIYADRVRTKELCIEDVCITKSELQQVLNNRYSNSGGSYTPPNVPGNTANTETGSSSSSNTTADSTTTTNTDTQVTDSSNTPATETTVDESQNPTEGPVIDPVSTPENILVI